MIKDVHKTVVVFRQYSNGEIIALFPEIEYSAQGYCESYMHIGQHGSADYKGCIKSTSPAKDFSKLQKELENIGYNLEIRVRYKIKGV